MKKFLVFSVFVFVAVASSTAAAQSSSCTKTAAAAIERRIGDFEAYMSARPDQAAEVLKILREEGIPEQFLYLMLAESTGKADAKSRAGARGLWQLTAPTARTYGCTDRTDPEQATRAAARYLKKLTKDFNGDLWQVVAAYNQGGHNLKKSGPTAEARALADIVQCLFLTNPLLLE